MKVKNFSKKEYNEFKELHVDTIHCEAILYLIPSKDRWNKTYKVFKDFYINEGTSFSNKLSTINTLNNYRNDINIEELIIPNEFCSIDSNLQGYLMDFVRGNNLSKALVNNKITLEEKINYLKQIGNLLKKIKSLRMTEDFKDFYLDDLHEDNIMIDCDGIIKVVDLDSCKIGGNLPSPSKYLVNLKKKGIINNKYKIDNYFSDIISPNEDTDNYCYTIMLLNFLYQDNISKLGLDEFYNYIDYLSRIGIDKNLIDVFYNLYTNKHNENPVEYLDYLDINIYTANKKVYEYKKESNFLF